jgi:hypothetical protein
MCGQRGHSVLERWEGVLLEVRIARLHVALADAVCQLCHEFASDHSMHGRIMNISAAFCARRRQSHSSTTATSEPFGNAVVHGTTKQPGRRRRPCGRQLQKSRSQIYTIIFSAMPYSPKSPRRLLDDRDRASGVGASATDGLKRRNCTSATTVAACPLPEPYFSTCTLSFSAIQRRRVLPTHMQFTETALPIRPASARRKTCRRGNAVAAAPPQHDHSAVEPGGTRCNKRKML